MAAARNLTNCSVSRCRASFCRAQWSPGRARFHRRGSREPDEKIELVSNTRPGKRAARQEAPHRTVKRANEEGCCQTRMKARGPLPWRVQGNDVLPLHGAKALSTTGDPPSLRWVKGGRQGAFETKRGPSEVPAPFTASNGLSAKHPTSEPRGLWCDAFGLVVTDRPSQRIVARSTIASCDTDCLPSCPHGGNDRIPRRRDAARCVAPSPIAYASRDMPALPSQSTSGAVRRSSSRSQDMRSTRHRSGEAGLSR